MNGRKPTINDVADLAGVSKKTVSRVINASPLVSNATREGIQLIIDEIGYRPDPQARGLALRRSYLVGLIYDNPNPQYVVNVQQGVLDGLRGTGFELVVHPCDRKSESFLDDARKFVELQKLYGVVVTPSVSEDGRLAEVLRDVGCEYVRIASVALDLDERMIVTNDRLGAVEAGKHLGELGHKRVGMVTGRRSFRSARERREGFEEGLAQFGVELDPEYVVQGDYTFESGLARGTALIDLEPPPTAIFAANDEMAAGVMQSALVAGLKVPDELSVVGFDNFQTATRIWPRLTTVGSPIRKIGTMAARQLLSVAFDTTIDIEVNQTRPKLVRRESSRKPPD
ncbi:MAG: LacI family DNA-binding transcriptional regulator [Gammaproteobacteria bacterium]